MELPKNKTALVVGVVAAGIVTTIAVAFAVWPALVKPEPPLEKVGDGGLRIRVVEPPKAVSGSSSLLDVGLSEAAQAMTKGREALFVRTPPLRPAPPPLRSRPAPVQVAERDDEADLAPLSEPVIDDRWAREAWRRDRFEQAQFERARQEERRRWEDERLAREERAPRDRRREAAPEQDRYEDRYAPPPDQDPAPTDRW